MCSKPGGRSINCCEARCVRFDGALAAESGHTLQLARSCRVTRADSGRWTRLWWKCLCLTSSTSPLCLPGAVARLSTASALLTSSCSTAATPILAMLCTSTAHVLGWHVQKA